MKPLNKLEYLSDKGDYPRKHYTPKGGWQAKTWYIVEVKMTSTNPVHRKLLFTGFLNNYGNPAGYSGLMALNYADDEVKSFYYPYYLKPISELYISDNTLECE